MASCAPPCSPDPLSRSAPLSSTPTPLISHGHHPQAHLPLQGPPVRASQAQRTPLLTRRSRPPQKVTMLLFFADPAPNQLMGEQGPVAWKVLMFSPKRASPSVVWAPSSDVAQWGRERL